MSKKIYLTGCAALLSLGAISQTKTLDVEEVVSTSTKIQVDQKESSKPVKVISREEIEKSGATSVASILDLQAGVEVNGSWGNLSGTQNLYMRGAGNRHILILVDGQPVVDPAAISGAIDLRMLSLANVERIEILKGCQSTLYGSDAMAGVINIITRKAGEEGSNFFGSASYGAFETWDVSAGTSVKKEKAEMSVMYHALKADGISEAKDSTDGELGFDKDGFESHSLKINSGVDLHERVRLEPFFSRVNNTGGYDAGAFADGDNSYEHEYTSVGTRIKTDLNKLKAFGTYGFDQVNRVFNTAWGVNHYRGRVHNADAVLSYEVTEQINVVGGVFGQSLKMLDTNGIKTNPRIEQLAPYLNVVVKNLKGINLQAGVRGNHHSVYGNNFTYSVAPSYNVLENVQVFAAYATSFKAPTLSEMYGQWGANPNLRPERSKGWEAGVRASFMDQRLKAEINAFERDTDSIIIYDFANGYTNFESQNAHGFEMDVRYQHDTWLSASANYAYVYGTVVADKEETYNLIRKPTHSIAFTISASPIKNLNVTLASRYRGLTHDIAFINWVSEEKTLESFFVTNLSVAYAMPNQGIEFFGTIRNLTNADFMEVYGYNTMKRNGKVGLRFNL